MERTVVEHRSEVKKPSKKMNEKDWESEKTERRYIKKNIIFKGLTIISRKKMDMGPSRNKNQSE